MAFRLKRKSRKSVGAQLSRIVAKELRKATEEVSQRAPRDESIHVARTHVKKIRAVLHLLRAELGGDYSELNDRVRSVSRDLSAVRDADALIETIETLRRHYRDVLKASVYSRAEHALKDRKRDAYAHLAGRRLSGVRQRLVHSRRDIVSEIKTAASGRALRDGVKRGYRRARQAMADATTSKPEDVRFHAWRRRVKDHWYQMRLVEGLSGRVRGRIRRLKQLQEWLGDDHNLVVLRSVILEEPRRFGDAKAVAVILGCIDKQQAQLRRRAVRRGRRLFSSRPSSFEKQISRLWT